MFLFSFSSFFSYFHEKQTIFHSLFQIERIVEELELQDCFIVQPSSVNFFNTVDDSKSLDVIRDLLLVALQYRSRLQVCLPFSHVHALLV